MSHLALEVTDIFRSHGPAWRQAHAGHVSLDQLKVMSAIERCRTAALGGHVARCADRAYPTIAYNSCRNRHCPKCQGAAAKDWLADREADLLPEPYPNASRRDRSPLSYLRTAFLAFGSSPGRVIAPQQTGDHSFADFTGGPPCTVSRRVRAKKSRAIASRAAEICSPDSRGVAGSTSSLSASRI